MKKRYKRTRKLLQYLSSLLSLNYVLLEKAFLPLSNKGWRFNVFDGLCRIFYFIGAVIGLPFSYICYLFAKTTNAFRKKNIPFSLKKFCISPQWDRDIRYLPQEIGVVTSEFQVSGGKNLPHSSWADWEINVFPNGEPHIADGHSSGCSLNYWNNPDLIIKKLKSIGIQYYRLSIERSLIEPEEGRFSEKNINRYKFLLERLRESGIKPWVMLHHFTDPNWFIKKGGFENEKNIEGFIKFSEKAFHEFSPYVSKWGTINEPTSYIFQGYVRGVYPPGKKNIAKAATVLKNLMITHCRTYNRLKRLKNGDQSEIGMTHNFMRFHPYHQHNLIEKLASFYTTKITHDILMKFIKTGEFRFHIPFFANVNLDIKDHLKHFDYLGLQYYSEPIIRMQLKPPFLISSHRSGEEMTNMPYRFYPQGLAFALQECKHLNIPLYISEIGIDASDAKRLDFFEKVFKIISCAMEEKIDLRGVYIWTLEDNFEWDYGWNNSFGLYSSEKCEPRSYAYFLKGLLQGIKATSISKNR